MCVLMLPIQIFADVLFGYMKIDDRNWFDLLVVAAVGNFGTIGSFVQSFVQANKFA